MSHPLDHFFRPVGKVVVLFSQIETTLIILATGMCIREFNAVSALMAEASFQRKLDALKCIGDEKLRDPALHAKLAELLKRLQSAEDIRNRVAHTLWAGSKDAQLMTLKWSAKRKKGNLPGLKHTTLQEIDQMGEEIQATFHDLVDLMRLLQNAGILKINFVQDGPATAARQ
jgi:hypothetical protein